jgi:fumarate reductase flavoprotein subunit
MKQLKTEIAVIGGGTAGLTAAVAAAEKGNTTGGTGNMGMGPFAVESKLQRARNITLTKEDAFKLI